MRLVTQEQIVINVKLDTMVMEIHVLPVALTRLHLQVSATTGTDCNQCETGYYGDGTTCTTCGTHKTTPASGSATTVDQCKLTLF